MRRRLELLVGIGLGVVLLVVSAVGYLSARDAVRMTDASTHVRTIERHAHGAYERELACSEAFCRDDKDCSEGQCCIACDCRPCGAYARVNRRLHQLCGSAIPVPLRMPTVAPVKPDDGPSDGFNTGTAVQGWRCLHFRHDDATWHQLGYNAAGGPRVPNCGSDLGLADDQPLPCPCGYHGFVAWAAYRSKLDGSTVRIERHGSLNERCQLVTEATENHE